MAAGCESFVLSLLTGATPVSLLPASIQFILQTLKSSPNEDTPPLLERYTLDYDSRAQKQQILTYVWSPLSTDGEEDVTGKIITIGIPCRQVKGNLKRADKYLCFESTFKAFNFDTEIIGFWVHCYFRFWTQFAFMNLGQVGFGDGLLPINSCFSFPNLLSVCDFLCVPEESKPCLRQPVSLAETCAPPAISVLLCI